MTGSSLTLPVKGRCPEPRALQAERQVRRAWDGAKALCRVLSVGWEAGLSVGGRGWLQRVGGGAEHGPAVGPEQVGPKGSLTAQILLQHRGKSDKRFMSGRPNRRGHPSLWLLHGAESEGWGALKTLDPALSPSSSFLTSISSCPGSLTPLCPVMRHHSSWHRDQRPRRKGRTGRATRPRSQKLLQQSEHISHTPSVGQLHFLHLDIFIKSTTA